MPRALITGITGQDGSYLAEFLLARGYEVHGVVRRASTFNTDRIDHLYRDPHDPEARLRLHYGDLTDSSGLRVLLERVEPDEVYNLGAQSHVRVSFDQPEYTADVDALGTLRLLEAVRDYQGRTKRQVRFYQAGSSEMFGTAPPPQNERTPFHPRSPYGVAKVFAHWQTVNYREAYGLFAANGILFNHECVTAETPVIVRRNGLIDIIPIEEVVPHRTNPRHGTRYTSTPLEAIDVWDRDGWTRVTCMTATWNRGQKQIVRVAARGAVFSATSDHIVLLENEQERPAGSIAVGDFLALGSSPEPTAAVEMTEAEAWLLGVLTGDGYVNEDGDVRVISNDEVVLAECSSAWPATTGGLSRRWTGRSGFGNRAVMAVNLTGAQAYGRYLRPQLYTRWGNKRVPARILNATREAQLAFLRGYNAADGLRAGRSKYEFKSFKTASPCLAAGLWWLARAALGQRAILCLEDRGDRTYFTINLSVPDSERVGAKGAHLRRPVAEVVKVMPLRHEGWLFDLATESGTFLAGVGDGWIHNSPRRGETFVTRKITRAATRIALGLQSRLYLGNLDARRDWGYAGDYVEAMWLILQHREPDDFVIATGESRSVRDVLNAVFGLLNMDWEKFVAVDPRYFRPAEIDRLEGDASKAREVLGWRPRVSFDELLGRMVDHDMELAQAERTLRDAGHRMGPRGTGHG